MKYTHILAGVVTAVIAVSVYALPAAADTNASCSVLPQSICDASTKSDGGDTSKSAIVQLLVWVLRILTGAVGIAAVGALIFAGVTYSSAGNNTTQVGKAKTIITDTVIGVVAYGFMFIILNWLIPGGVFG
jgi:hypothetical protein